ncbi:MAG: Gfo/Idh/MocA family oxidoreductase [Candidatus Cybelea sp.]|jgi:myo-inositol 2-dehydrogenase/D-chiro-inositol 1-dehydrogenase
MRAEEKPMPVAVIGCGRMGKVRAQAARHLGAQVKVVIDPMLERRASMQAMFPTATGLADVRQFDWSSVAAAFICTPPGQREEAVQAGMIAGTALMIEKPVGISAGAADGLIELQKRYRNVVAVGYMNRSRPSIKRARALLLSEKPLGLAAHWIGSEYRTDWWLDDRSSGGPFNEQGTHLVDLVRYLLGDVEAVTSLGQGPAQKEVTLGAVLRSRRGGIATILYSWGADNKNIELSLFTGRGALRWSGWEFRLVENTTALPICDDAIDDVFLLETERFLGAVRGNGSVECDLQDAVRSQMLVDAVKQSMILGTAVRLDAESTDGDR